MCFVCVCTVCENLKEMHIDPIFIGQSVQSQALEQALKLAEPEGRLMTCVKGGRGCGWEGVSPKRNPTTRNNAPRMALGTIPMAD